MAEGARRFVSTTTPLLDVDGERVGTAYRGAAVTIRDDDGVAAHIDGDTVGVTPLRLASAALSVDNPGAPTPPAYTRSIEYRQIQVASGHSTFTTKCGIPVGLLGDAGDKARVAQRVGGLELEGLAVHTRACPAPTGAAPVGYVQPGPFPIRTFASDGDFWILAEDTTTNAHRCEHLTHRGKLLLSRSDVEDGTRNQGAARMRIEPVVAERQYRIEGAGPSIREQTVITFPFVRTRYIPKRPDHVGEGMALCGEWQVLLVGQNADGLIMLGDGRSRGGGNAYHPANASVWYTSQVACQGAADHLSSVASATERVASIPVRGGCD